MEPVTVSMDQLKEWGWTAYWWSHVLFALVTHYHSVWQIRKYNGPGFGGGRGHVPTIKVFLFFFFRMAFAFPYFAITRLVSPIGLKWHLTPEEIETFSLDFEVL